MYVVFIAPGGVSPSSPAYGGLTRALCFDLVLKGWMVIDLPFPISTAYQARPVTSNPITLIGSFGDGTLQTMAGRRSAVGHRSGRVGTSCRHRMDGPYSSHCVQESRRTSVLPPRRRPWIYGSGIQRSGDECSVPRLWCGGVEPERRPPVLAQLRREYFSVDSAVEVTDDIFDAIITGTGQITLDGFDFHMQPKPLGALSGMIA